MKTSLDLPDELYRRVKSKSALEGRAVREVATALFSAWVEGRVATDAAAGSTAVAPTDDADPRRQWLARWSALGASVTHATADTTGLIDQMRHDRR